MEMKIHTMADVAVIALCLATIVFVANRPITVVYAGERQLESVGVTDSVGLEDTVVVSVRDTLADLARAFAMVESTDNPKAYNASSDATGWLQFKKIMVDEANRIQNINKRTDGIKYYVYDDRWSKEKSLEMFKVVMRHRNPKLDIRKACEIWKYDYGKGYIDAVTENYSKILTAQI